MQNFIQMLENIHYYDFHIYSLLNLNNTAEPN